MKASSSAGSAETSSTPARRFRAAFWPTVMAVPMVLVMLALGTWQLQRLEWKTALIGERTARITAEPVDFPLSTNAVLGALEFRRSALTGRFLHERELYLAARSQRGNPGYQVITPLEVTAARQAGAIVLVNRGWVPVERKDPASRPEGQVRDEVTVDGVIRLSGVQHWMVPDNEPANNVWFWADLQAMARSVELHDLAAPAFLEAGPAENPGGFPIGGQTRINLPNDHLQYAITWYALAVALAVIWYVYNRRRQRAPETPSPLPGQDKGGERAPS